MSFDTDVLISGAEAAGPTLAIDLARRGVSFRLIEQNTQPFSGSRGKDIQPRTIAIFEDLGFIDRVATGGSYSSLRQYCPDGIHIEDRLYLQRSAENQSNCFRNSGSNRALVIK
ncbi:FAD-dependent monooxygenase [Acetobacter pasteurianus]|uniref:FAD-dependent monooxygenase n=1 Tax=Acetobacter pasteurianus TaxID=438 RepID=UPI001EECF7FF|nr:FAD-dependent monooxygenase [Acetobacter pasteurianus]WKC16465.1 FAD-dependent monooxygenase [Acetobacter pasteurianus]